MGLVASTIESIATAIPDTVYLRLSDAQKAEFEVSRTALAGKTAILYANNPDIAITQNPVTISEAYPVQIWFLQLQPNPDDVNIDTVLDACKYVAFDFYTEFRKEANTPWNNWEETTAIQLNNTSAYQIGNEYLSGWELTFTLSLESCPATYLKKYDFTIDEQGWTKAGGAGFFDYDPGNGWKWIDTGGFPAFGGTSIQTPGIPSGKYLVTIEMDTTSGAALDFDLLEFGETPVTFSIGEPGVYKSTITLLGSLDLFFVKNNNSTPDRDFVLKSITLQQGGTLF